jgi:hypothetical protein
VRWDFIILYNQLNEKSLAEKNGVMRVLARYGGIVHGVHR